MENHNFKVGDVICTRLNNKNFVSKAIVTHNDCFVTESGFTDHFSKHWPYPTDLFTKIGTGKPGIKDGKFVIIMDELTYDDIPLGYAFKCNKSNFPLVKLPGYFPLLKKPFINSSGDMNIEYEDKPMCIYKQEGLLKWLFLDIKDMKDIQILGPANLTYPG